VPAATVGIEVVGDRQVDPQAIDASQQQCTRWGSRTVTDPRPQHLPRPYSRFRRARGRVRTSPFAVPLALLLGWAIVVIGLARVADLWIVALAATPLPFALLLTLLCWWAYRRDFYA